MEALDVEAELSGVPEQVGEAEVVLAGEQQVVHLPEDALGRGGLGSLGGQLGLRVDVGQRKVPPDVADVGVGEERTHDGLRLTAVRTLEVPELDDGDG